MRLMIAVVLAVAGSAITFTQLGFVDVVLPGGTVIYVVVLLQIVALGALLFGTLAGVAFGVAIGAVLFAHSHFLPLDHYELSFITPMTSMVMLGISGLLLGVLFALALRKSPSRARRVLRIAIACIVVSWLYSLGFAINVFVSSLVELVEDMGVEVSESYVRQRAAATAMGLGDMGLQAWADAILMIFLCTVGDYASCKAKERRGTLGLRTLFGAWLTVVVALGFMVMSAVSFAVISEHELREAEDLMRDEVDYLSGQFEDSDKRSGLMASLLEQAGLEYDELDDEMTVQLAEAFSDDRILSGYSTDEDGVVIVTLDKYVYVSNVDSLEGGDAIEDVLDRDILNAFELCIETGEMQRFVYDGSAGVANQYEDADAERLHPHIAYLYAKRMETSYDWGQDYHQDVIMIRPSSLVFEQRGTFIKWMVISELVLLLAVFALVFQLLERVVARRIDEENEALALITAGELYTRTEAGGTREFESLSEGINTTVDALRGLIAEAETRMDEELDTAKAIQESALPQIFPPYPDIRKFDIYASMQAAKQVGGDFYDFFLIGDDNSASAGRIAFVVADVSGKGIPAALFMMKAKAQIRGYVGSGMELGEAMEEANRQLCEGNEASMFVTAWVGVLDYATGHVEYVNAGHNPPLLWQRDGGWRWMRQKSGPMLGLFDVSYQAHAVECIAGDTFLLYSDGVTEAFDVDEALYGEERLLAVAELGYRLHPRELLESVRANVAEYAAGAEQSDDITILALEVGVPPEVTATLEVRAVIEELSHVNDFLHAELERRMCPLRAQTQLDIAVEELFVNVCSYAYPEAVPDDPGIVRIQRTYSADPPSITVDIIDEGVPYNPLSKPDAVTPSNIEDVPIGGLGILMAKKSVDEMRYERMGDSNIVTIMKKW